MPCCPLLFLGRHASAKVMIPALAVFHPLAESVKWMGVAYFVNVFG
jgi:hypothetical protein